MFVSASVTRTASSAWLQRASSAVSPKRLGGALGSSEDPKAAAGIGDDRRGIPWDDEVPGTHASGVHT